MALKALKKEAVAEMKHVDHVINEREILFYLNEVNHQIIRPRFNIATPNKLKENESISSDDEQPNLQCPFLM